ncbi:tRNA uracil 4-sulfurtransferase ThiI [Salsuginibacillus kocurii]|uniref:tRNA uracil 4-sulfurtransferase ThiI n=1 Tax=Salsuginibacillus kocurii TaxID=427078 RepID=UPI00037500B4|nr:tRNA uracil 4-sulfurtransferase ThiI [Salsuginibacillus kocurii]
MKLDHILVRYGELALKGKNRSAFENKLKENIIHALKGHPTARTKKTYGRILVEINEEDPDELIAKLKHVFGISSLSFALKVPNDVEEMKAGALQAFHEAGGNPKTLKIKARRAYKHFPIGSEQLAPEIGAHVLRNTEGVGVDLKNPDVLIQVEVREQGTYISYGKIEAVGGLPLGTSGKVLLMLSGGIDSPVAGYKLMRRGTKVEAIHFHTPPYTNERARQKVEDLTQILATYGGTIRLHVVPFTEMQIAMKEHIPSQYMMTVMRRMMMRIAERIAEREDILAIGNGENLGQVASQTLESMNAINEVTTLPILRPLLSDDKQEVIDVAHSIGTYETSILPHEDCCTVFAPTDAKTKPKREKVSAIESSFQFSDLVEDAVTRTETLAITRENKRDQKMDELL